MRKEFLFTIVIIIAVAFFEKNILPQKIYATGKVSCNVSTWPQKATINGISYNCSLNRGYCNSIEALNGNAQCCSSANFGKDDCRDIKPGMTLYSEHKTLSTGESYYLGDDRITVNSIDARANPRQVWFSYFNRGYKVDDAIKREGDVYNYNDGYNDLINMKADSIFAGASFDMVNFKNIYVKKSIICDEKWACYDWSSCINGEQTRNCVDLNECGGTFYKPFTKKTCLDTRLINDVYNRKTMVVGETWNLEGNYKIVVNSIDARANPRQVWLSLFLGKSKLDDGIVNQGGSYIYSDVLNMKVDSIFAGATSDMAQFKDVYMKISALGCVENWSNCGPWSECSNGNSSRICIDSNNCGTVSSKPATILNCSEPIPTSTPTSTSIPTSIPLSTPSPSPSPTAAPSPTSTPISTPTITPTPVSSFLPASTPAPASIPIPSPTISTLSSPIPTSAPKAKSTPAPALTPTPVSSPSSNYNSEEELMAQSIKEGAIIRAEGDIDVYIVKYIKSKKFKRLILSPSVFNNYGHLKWENIVVVNKPVLDLFITSDLVKAVDDEKIYRLYPSEDIGEKRWVKTSEAFERMGFDWDEVYEINQFDRDSYITGFVLE